MLRLSLPRLVSLLYRASCCVLRNLSRSQRRDAHPCNMRPRPDQGSEARPIAHKQWSQLQAPSRLADHCCSARCPIATCRWAASGARIDCAIHTTFFAPNRSTAPSFRPSALLAPCNQSTPIERRACAAGCRPARRPQSRATTERSDRPRLPQRQPQYFRFLAVRDAALRTVVA
jgi:hypothetical protein